ncbi:MAG: hypothetical protein IK025_13000 [Bacteroidales bacterium]|nr:hypothetical protein [Bacteroidales bacterium]
MKKIIFLIIIHSLCIGVFAQEITVRFTGLLNGTDYCRLDRVVVTNLTRNWSETMEYPDTIIVLGCTVNSNINIATTQGLGQNIPNPFDCETRVELSVSKREDVRMQLLDVSGKIYAEYNGSLDAGVHTFDISVANPQTYLLNATVGNHQYSIRMVNVGSGCSCSINYTGVSSGIEAKLTTTNEFQIGDNMRYVGYATIDGQTIISAAIEQPTAISQNITLNFSQRSSPCVETLAATDITNTSATLHGNIVYNGGSTVTSRGFYYGTSSDNLSQMAHAGIGVGEYTASISDLSEATTYYYCTFATNNLGTSIGEVMSFTTTITTGTLNGYEWVDLGLPSGTLWATCNVGANTSEAYGNYYAWGETTTKPSYSESNYTYTDDPVTLPPSADAATVNWGDGWRMPTKEMAIELVNNCDVARVVRNGISGWLLTGPNNNSIFFPAAGSYINGDPWYHGLYWTSSIYTNNMTSAWNIELFNDGSYIGMYHTERYDGLSVRPVCGNDTPTSALPVVQTNDVTNVTTNRATVSGTVVSDGGANVSSRGFVYGTNANDLSQRSTSGSGTGSFTKTLTSLNSCTTYYCRAYATNSSGTAYGELMSFSTISIPTVTTGNVGNITGTEATFSGNVYDDGNAIVTDRGFMYGTNENNLSEVVQCGGGTGSYMGNISNLTEGTTYYYKAYATNTAGTAYGVVRSFSTLSLPIVTTGTASSIPATGATFTGSVRSGSTVTDRGFIYGTSSTNLTQTVQSGSGQGDFTTMLSDLAQSTTYYYKAYATNSAGTAYGEIMSFTTKTLAPTGYINGYGYVDLGLPSGMRWATCNTSGRMFFKAMLILC